jgi:hypothetical protein
VTFFTFFAIADPFRGATRLTVSRVAHLLQYDGVTRIVRGRITVLNWAKLEKASCECHGAVARHDARALRLAEEQRAKHAKTMGKHKGKPEN